MYSGTRKRKTDCELRPLLLLLLLPSLLVANEEKKAPRNNLVRQRPAENLVDQRAGLLAAALQLVQQVRAELVHVLLLRVAQRLPVVVLREASRHPGCVCGVNSAKGYRGVLRLRHKTGERETNHKESCV